MKKTLILAAMTPLFVTGCAGMFNTADNDSFSCPGMPQGIICKTPLAVYKSTNQMPQPTDNDMPIGVKASGVKTGDDLGNVVSPEPAAKLGLPGLPNNMAMARPIRTPAQVMRIWVGPWIDSKDDLHYPSYLFTEVQPRRWSFGKTEFAGKGLIVPHRELAEVAPVPQDQDQEQPNEKGGALKKKSDGAHQPDSGKTPQQTPPQQAQTPEQNPATADVPTPGMPSPSDINLD